MLKDGCGTAHRRAHQRGSPAGRERRSHCIPWTHAEEVNAELLSFLGGKAGKSGKRLPRQSAVRAPVILYGESLDA